MPRGARTELPPLAARVLDELLAVRKTSEGWTVATAGLSPTICAVLGGGDPHAAFSALRVAVLSLIDSPGVVAASASLGLTTDLPTHTDRLNDAGGDLGLSERQVRRLSDAGLIALARFIATNWNQGAVPVLSLTLIRTGDKSADLAIGTRCLRNIEMRDPSVTFRQCELRMYWSSETNDHVVRQRVVEQLELDATDAEVSVQWRGELFPHFHASLIGPWGRPSFESLGNRLTVALQWPAD